jgi:ketosteroid isomerase-like protein
MKRRNIEFLWAWLDALRRRDTETMAGALDPSVVWQGIREGLVCTGAAEVVAAFVSAYDANQEIDSLELLGGERHIILGVHAHDLGEIDGDDFGGEIYNLFTIEHEKITRIEDYLDRDEAVAAAGLAGS